MAGYYIREGSAHKFLIFLEGGGWCYDSHCSAPSREGTLGDCRQRAGGRLGSSRGWPRTQDSYDGMLSADAGRNPVFHDWTLIYVPYCDGASFTGDTVIDDLHFRGQAILRSLIVELKAATGIRDAEQVVLSGGSAGASSVYFHVDTVAEELDLLRGEVLGLPDAGFFLDLKDKDGIDCWPAQMRSLFGIIDGYKGLHRRCLERFFDEPSKCLFPENYADIISSRVFALNSFYDSSETSATLRLDCCPGGCRGRAPACTGRELQLFEALRGQHAKAWAPLIAKNGSGIWASSCVAHTMSWNRWTDLDWEVPANSGNTMAAVVSRWLEGDDSDGRHFVYEDPVSWPEDRPCTPNADVQQRELLQV